jgi:hypothetical protein
MVSKSREDYDTKKKPKKQEMPPEIKEDIVILI